MIHIVMLFEEKFFIVFMCFSSLSRSDRLSFTSLGSDGPWCSGLHAH